jgi:murein L,D-transpeptidase YafK
MGNMFKNTILLILLSNFLFSNVNFVEIYKTKGIQEVEKLLSKKLQNKIYWDKQLQNKDVTNGYYESLKYILVCNKDLSHINLYDATNNNHLYTSSVLVGEKQGAKHIEGDLKTPIGAYKLVQKLTKLDPFYGPFALSTNYPNKFDKSLGKTGHGIWIHGVPFEQKRKPFTKGCIALENNNLLTLNKQIALDKSILIIDDKNSTQTTQNQISTILSEIFIWRDAWKYGDFEKYISFYSQEFKKSDGKSYSNFKNYKQSIFQRKEKKKILFTNIDIIPYPNDLDKIMFEINMDEDYKTRNYKFKGKKHLYIELIDNRMQILFE